MADADHEDEKTLVLDAVDNAVVPGTDPVQVIRAFELLDARRAWVLGQGIDPGRDAPLVRARQIPEGLDRWRRDLDGAPALRRPVRGRG